MSDTLTLGQPVEDVDAAAPGDLVLWSVTTLIDVLAKDALIYWSAEQTAIAAVQGQRVWQAILEERGQDEAVDWLKGARFRPGTGQLSAAKLGSVVHAACEEYALTGVRPDRARLESLVRTEGGPKFPTDGVTNEAYQVEQFVDCFDNWLQEFTPSYQATEVVVYSPKYGYAGQADAFCTIDGVRFIVDYKSTRKSFDNRGKPTSPYPEQVGLQLAGYRFADMAAVWRPRRFEQFRRRYYLLSPAEQEHAVPVPEVDHGLVIHIAPQHCVAYPIECGPEVHRAFLFTQECARWVQQTSKTVMGPPLTKGGI